MGDKTVVSSEEINFYGRIDRIGIKIREPLINSESFRCEVKIGQIKPSIVGKTQSNRFAHGASFSQSIGKIGKASAPAHAPHRNAAPLHSL